MMIKQAKIEDAREILTLQKLAYQSEAAIYNDYTIPPLVETKKQVEAAIQKQVYLKVIIDHRIIGSVRAYLDNGTCFIGRLIVHPDFQNQGIGTKLLLEVEQTFGQARRLELFTGHKSKRNLYLYNKLGYRQFKTETVNNRLKLIFLKKEKNPH